jgi:hypothetical protein
MRSYWYLDCSTCYSQNGLGHWEEGQVIYSKVMIYLPLDAKFQGGYESEKGSFIYCAWPLQYWMQNAIEFTPPQRDYEHQVYVPCYGCYGQYFQKWHK